jgi:hypothetical protein
MRPLLPADAQAAPGFYLLPDNVFVQVRAGKNGRTYALRYFPESPMGPWVFAPGLASAMAHLSPMRPREAFAVGRHVGALAA